MPLRKDKKRVTKNMQKIERDTLHRLADELTMRNHDRFHILSKSYVFSQWVEDFSKGDEDLEQRLFDENDEMTGVLYALAKKYGILDSGGNCFERIIIKIYRCEEVIKYI